MPCTESMTKQLQQKKEFPCKNSSIMRKLVEVQVQKVQTKEGKLLPNIVLLRPRFE